MIRLVNAILQINRIELSSHKSKKTRHPTVLEKDGKRPFFSWYHHVLSFLYSYSFSTVHRTSFTFHYLPAVVLMFPLAQ